MATLGRVEQKLKDMGYELEQVGPPAANYVMAVQVGELVFVSGTTSARPDGTRIAGKIGRDLTVEEGYEGARYATLRLLARLKACIGDLDRVKRVIRVFGMVNCDPDTVTCEPGTPTPTGAVMNGCSDLLVELFGESGRHVRCAIGVMLPNASVEIETTFQV